MNTVLKSTIELYVINKVREKRIEKNISQAHLAYLLNVSRGFIGKVESEKHASKYNINHINNLAKIFGCSPKDFMPETDL
jgi:transcriptional regulator with XRE-family HTH domain